MNIDVRAEVTVGRPLAEVFEAAAGRVDNLAKYFTGYAALIPAIVSASYDDGEAPRAGSLRTVKLSDGSAIKERVLAFEPNRAHDYDMAEMNTLQKLICTNMVSRWRFSERASTTRVVWDYTIEARPLLAPLGWLTAQLFERAMQRCLDNLQRDLKA
ncbi:MAG: SRPBCC family protein [Myxococcales bacterium]|nr:SRPBCC family protein [Myxococcales bacterium]